MRFTLASAALATLATTASATNFQVIVGGSALEYNPNQVTANPGDTVEFVFMPKNHTVTQTSFGAPCQPMAGGLSSGFQPVAANATQVPSFVVPVNATTPLWFSCQQTGHCEAGMVFAINPTANKTFAAFQAAAQAATAGSSNTTGSGSSTSVAPSASAAGSGAAASSSTPTSTSGSTASSNGAIATGARAGGLLALVGLAAGILL